MHTNDYDLPVVNMPAYMHSMWLMAHDSNILTVDRIQPILSFEILVSSIR
jgi:hypothetical protein